MKNVATVERKSDHELVITRLINGPARLVFEAWTKAEVFEQWWVPKSSGMSLVSCAMDVRVGGTYRLVFRHPAAPEPMAFYGRYLEVTPNARLVWTNEESGDAGQVSTLTFAEMANQTQITLHELYPSKEALDEAIASGAQPLESCDQLEELMMARSA